MVVSATTSNEVRAVLAETAKTKALKTLRGVVNQAYRVIEAELWDVSSQVAGPPTVNEISPVSKTNLLGPGFVLQADTAI